MEHKKSPYITRTRLLILGLLIFLIAGAAAVFTQFARHKQPEIISEAIKHRIAYQIYVPDTNNRQWSVAKDSVKYDSNQGLLSLTASSGGNNIYITEQNTPSQFTDIPQYYPALLGKLNEYSEIQTSLGAVALTHPKELNGGQTAVINSHGTLMFIRPQNNLTDDQWKQFINSFDVIK